MSEVLLGILDETVDALASRMREIQGVIDQRKVRIQEAQQHIRAAEHGLKCAAYDDERAIQRVDVLTAYITRLGNGPQVLEMKARDLGEARKRTREARRVAEEKVAATKADLETKQTELAVIEEEYADVGKKRSEVSALASQERANAQA
jgi:chromosome segregation ATPase